MKVLSLTVVFILSLTIKAQISIDSTHMPVAGDSLRFSVAALDTAVLFGYQNNGANQQWNFDSLEALRQGVRRYYASANTPYNNQVTNRLGLKVADTLALGGISLYDVYDFYNNSSTEFAKDYRAASVPTGLSFPFPPTLNLAPSFSDKDEVYQFPLSYQDRDSSTFAFSYSNSLIGAYYGSSGYRINEVDAWGSLTTPFGTFNCLRVITDVVSYDTVSFGGNNFGINSHTREYKWLTTQFGMPAMIVSGNVIAGTFIPTNVQYRDSVRNVPSIFAPVALFTADTTTASIGDTITLNDNSISLTPPTHSWSISPSNFQFVSGTNANSMNPKVVFNANGLYDIELIISNSEGSDTLLRDDYIEIKNNTGLSEIQSQNQLLLIHPNPQKSGELINLSISDQVEIKSIDVIDAKGSLIKHKNYQKQGQHIKISTSELKQGHYFIRLNTTKGSLMKALIIQ